jgi:alkylation response protein AidB-like acyl-CoA dehydrogenase
MVDFELSEEQQGLREVSRNLLADHSASAQVRAGISGADAEAKLWELGTGLGWTGLAVPEADGGLGQGVAELTLVAEELGRAAARGPFLSTALAALAVARYGQDSLRSLVLPALAEGTARAALAVAEPGGWFPPTVRLTANGAAPGTLVLSGRKTLVADAGTADWLLVTAVADGEPVLVLVDADEPGIGIRRQEALDLTRNLYEVTFGDVAVDAARRFSGGAAAAGWLRDAAAVVTAADALGAGSRLMDLTVEHAKTRVQFGQPLGAFQAVKHKCADMRLLVTGTRAAVYYAAMALDAASTGTDSTGTASTGSGVCPEEASEAASTAKAFASAGMTRLAGEALQVHGGIGFTWEHDLHLYLRRIKADEQFYGDAGAHQERLAGFLLARRAG